MIGDDKLNTTNRNSSLDLLRVLAMFMIVISHCFTHGGVTDALNNEPFSVNFLAEGIVTAFTNVHVNCFVLISGYFLCTGKFKIGKLIKLWLDTFFWSVLLFILTVTFAGDIFSFSVKGFIKSLMPITQQVQEGYWFVTAYLLMYILSPLINYAIHSMNKRQHLTCIITFFLVFIALQNLLYFSDFTSINQHSPIFFLFLYFVAAYFRLYPPQKKRPWILGYIFSCGFVFLFKIFFPIIVKKLFEFNIGNSMFDPYNSVFVFIGSVCLFMTFAQIKISGKLAKLAVAISPLTFGIYLIHDNIQIRTLLWDVLIKPYQYISTPFMIFIIFGVSLLVLIVCACIEKLRIILFKALHIYDICDFAAKYITKLFNYIIDKVSLI